MDIYIYTYTYTFFLQYEWKFIASCVSQALFSTDKCGVFMSIKL